jgi:hypothetical protein
MITNNIKIIDMLSLNTTTRNYTEMCTHPNGDVYVAAISNLLSIKPLYSMYLAEDWDGGNIPDSSGNNRGNATTANVSKSKTSGNGASASIDILSGDTSGTITWPAGSIPSTFTIASITRYRGPTRGRIFNADTINWFHGHHIGSRGRSYYNAWVTPEQNIYGNSDDWLIAIGRKDAVISGGVNPNNILMNGVGYGLNVNGSGNNRLTINNSTIVPGEKSDFEYSVMLMWDTNLTDAEMMIVHNALNLYLQNGISLKHYFISNSIYKIPYESTMLNVRITNSGDTLTNYQINFTLNYNYMFNSSFQDIRVFDTDKTTLLDYYIEDIVIGVSALVWVKIPSLSSSKIIYIKGGYPNSFGDQTDVFDLYDTFNEFDSSKWNFTGSTSPPTISSSGIVQIPTGSINGNNGKYMVNSKDNMPLNSIVDLRMTASIVNTIPEVNFRMGNSVNNNGITCRYDTRGTANAVMGVILNRPFGTFGGGSDSWAVLSSPSPGQAFPSGTTIRKTRTVILDNTITAFYAPSLISTYSQMHTFNFGATASYNTIGTIGLANHNAGTFNVDEIRVYKTSSNTITITPDYLIEVQTTPSGNGTWNGLCSIGTDIYATANNGGIYKQINGTGSFVSLNPQLKPIITQGLELWIDAVNPIDEITIPVISPATFGATLAGNATRITTAPQYFNINGSPQYINTTYNPNLNNNTLYSWELWYWDNAPDLTLAEQTNVIGNYTTFTQAQAVLYITNTGFLRTWERNSAGTGENRTSTKQICDGIWHHIVVVATSTTLSLYIDGVLDGSVTRPGGTITSGQNITIGGGHFERYMTCRIGLVRMYRGRALSQDEIINHYQVDRSRFIGGNQWRGITGYEENGNRYIYAVVNGGDIYRSVNEGDFIGLGQTSRAWTGITYLKPHVYASVSNGDIYRQLNATGTFNALGLTARDWRQLQTIGDNIIAVDSTGTNGTGNLYINQIQLKQPTLLQAQTRLSQDLFGHVVAISSDGNTLVVGAYFGSFARPGSVYVYTRTNNTWSGEQRIQASDSPPNKYDGFGIAVALSYDGNTLMIGSSKMEPVPFQGSVYVYTRSGNTWTEQPQIQASDASQSDSFGRAVALSSDGNTLVVGAYGDDNSGGVNAGSVYVYTRSGNTWTEQRRIQASDASQDDFFGWSVALSSDGNTLVVGAYGDDNSGGVNAGSVYVYTRSNDIWTEQQRIQASDASQDDFFGHAVALSSDGNTLAVGVYGDDNSGGVNAGSVYVYTRTNNTWSGEQRIQASDASQEDRFGYAIALSSDGNTLCVGAIGYNLGTGLVYVYTHSNDIWTEQRRIQASNAAAYDRFGNAVALSSENTFVVGAYLDDNSMGSVYVFDSVFELNSLDQTRRGWYGVTISNNMLYASVFGGTIYRIPYLPLPTTGTISFSQINTEMNGNMGGPISLSSFRSNSATLNTRGVTNIPSGGTVSFSQFYGKRGIPVVTNLIAKYTGESWTGTTLVDETWSGNNSIAPFTTGGAISTGTANGLLYLHGGTNAAIRFPSTLMATTNYTLFFMTRYRHPVNNRGRIMNGNGTNWLSGQYINGIAGVAFHGGWITSEYPSFSFGNSWLLSTDQYRLYRGNMVNRTTSPNAASVLTQLTINDSNQDPSEWEFQCLYVYDRTLTLSEITTMETYLNSLYILNMTTVNWFNMFTRQNSAVYTITQTNVFGIILQLNSSSVQSSQTSLTYDHPIQKYSTFEINFFIKLTFISSTNSADGTSFNIGFNSMNGFTKGEGPNPPAICLVFHLYRISRTPGVYLFDGNTLISNFNFTFQDQFYPVRIIYNRSVINTWQIYFNNELRFTYSNPNNETWVNNTSGSVFGFCSRTGGETHNAYVRLFTLSATL